jgi:hypothetical protein
MDAKIENKKNILFKSLLLNFINFEMPVEVKSGVSLKL